MEDAAGAEEEEEVVAEEEEADETYYFEDYADGYDEYEYGIDFAVEMQAWYVTGNTFGAESGA